MRRIKREPAFYHLSNEEEAPWKAPGGYYPHQDDTQGNPTDEWPANQSSPSLHPLVLGQRIPDSCHEGNRLPPVLYSPQQGSQSSSLPAPPQGVSNLPPIETLLGLPPITFPPLPTPRIRPLRREPAFYHISPIAGAQSVAPGPDIFQLPLYPPTAASTTPAAPLPSLKREREDVEDDIDGDELSNKKRPRRRYPEGCIDYQHLDKNPSAGQW